MVVFVARVDEQEVCWGNFKGGCARVLYVEFPMDSFRMRMSNVVWIQIVGNERAAIAGQCVPKCNCAVAFPDSELRYVFQNDWRRERSQKQVSAV